MIAKRCVVAAIAASLTVLSVALASAEPPKFPDFSGYTPVDIADFRIDTTTPGVPANTVIFLTPDGISCDFTTQQAQCTGNNFPSVPPVKTDPSKGLNGANWIGTLTRLQTTSDPLTSGDTLRNQLIKTLPPFHSITFNGAICGVDDKGTTACKDAQGRGFVLSPSWSGWLPKV